MIRDTNAAQAVSYRDELVRHRLLIPTAARGVYGFGHDFDRVLQRFDAFVTRVGQDDGAEVIRFPTLLPRGDLEKSGYLESLEAERTVEAEGRAAATRLGRTSPGAIAPPLPSRPPGHAPQAGKRPSIER